MREGLRYFIFFLRTNPLFLLGVIIVTVVALAAVFAQQLAPFPPERPQPGAVLVPPGGQFLFGTDNNGMDILSRVIWAPRIDLTIALSSTLLAFVIGVLFGAWSGYFGGAPGVLGWASEFVLRATDISQAFPVFIFALALVAMLGASESNVIMALAFVNIPVFLRLTRAEVLRVRQKPFVDAARCVGNSEFEIAMRHVLPNSLTPALVQVSVVIGFAILLTAGLSFAGAGVKPPTPEWGVMVSQGARDMITGQWWPALFPGLFLGITVLGFALVGDGLRSFFDPTHRR
jgi:peptide/nickel transport system permease protein